MFVEVATQQRDQQNPRALTFLEVQSCTSTVLRIVMDTLPFPGQQLRKYLKSYAIKLASSTLLHPTVNGAYLQVNLSRSAAYAALSSLLLTILISQWSDSSHFRHCCTTTWCITCRFCVCILAVAEEYWDLVCTQMSLLIAVMVHSQVLCNQHPLTWGEPGALLLVNKTVQLEYAQLKACALLMYTPSATT